jgi:hypothetical protein
MSRRDDGADPDGPAVSTTTTTATTLRVVAAIATIAGGALHLVLWQGGFRGLPLIGPLFLANAVVATAAGIALGWRPSPLTIAIALGVSVSALGGLVLSHTVGFLGFMQGGWDAAQARVVATELLAVAATLALFVARRAPAVKATVGAA